MTENHFQVIDYLLDSQDWSLFWLVEIGVDRMHHAFWKFMDKSHHLYQPGNPFESAIYDYYQFLDEKIGQLLKNRSEHCRPGRFGSWGKGHERCFLCQ